MQPLPPPTTILAVDDDRSVLGLLESALRTAAANVEAFLARAADYTLTSPFDGFVLEKLLDTGAMVTNNDGILSLSTKDSMVVEGKVDELDANKIILGQKVLMSFDSLPEKVYEGAVRILAPRIDYATKSFKIKIALPADVPVRAGMSAELNILVLEKQRALLVPVNALSEGSVWLVQDGKVKKIPVKTGLRDSRKIEIVEGIKEGDTVVENPAGLSENQRVRVNAAR
jgi:RND family efflux transporter MFP subunit